LGDVSVDDARERYRSFLASSAEGTREPLVLPGFPKTDQFRDLVRRRFAEQPGLDALEVRTETGESVGYVTKARISEPDRTAAEGPGDSQGATLPGESTGYRVVWFKCSDHAPAIWIPQAYYDPRYPAACPQNPVHKTEYVP
jgi:hypothetical protein